MKSVLRYIGMKDINIKEFGLNSETIYCEPFSGSFNTGFKLYENGYTGQLIYNDLDEKVVNFWECIKEDNERLLNRIEQLNNILKSHFTDLERNRTLDNWYHSSDKYKAAAAEYVYRQYLTMDGLKWSFKNSIADRIDFYLFQEALQNIKLNNLDYKDIINKYDSNDTFFLIDPPYDICRVSNYYRCECNKFNHTELAEIVCSIKGNWLLTYNDNSNIRNLYKQYNIREVTRQLFGRKYTELYITKD